MVARLETTSFFPSGHVLGAADFLLVGCSPAWIAALPISAGTLPVAGLMLATGVLPLDPLALAAVVGQLIGGSMTATNLAGRRLKQELALRHGEVEAGLALGLTLRNARSLVARPVAAEALIPALDQSRTVGTVTLPGAFVGLVLGGASPLDAGLVQLVVLVSLLAAEAVAISAATYLAEAGKLDKQRPPTLANTYRVCHAGIATAHPSDALCRHHLIRQTYCGCLLLRSPAWPKRVTPPASRTAS